MFSRKILFVAPEVDPFVKVGGLADMVGALPKALAELGHDVRIVCPLYRSVRRLGFWRPRAEPLGIDVGPSALWARTWETSLPGAAVPCYFIENDALYGRAGVYGEGNTSYPDNDRRFIALSRAALTLCLQLDWIPDVVHAHDWTTGWVPVLLNTVLRDSPLGGAASVFTVHNLEHQGYAAREAVDYARIPPSEFHPRSLEALGAANPMKGGLYHATKITTVSPTYAQEIRRPESGCGLDDVLRFRGADLIGILNGIDPDAWNPATDATLPARYGPGDLAGKAVCKDALQRQLGLAAAPEAPLFGVVARLVHQKGLDLLAEALPALLATHPLQIALLGSGDPALEDAFRRLATANPGRVGVRIGFDAALARLVQAGSDAFIMPSRSEPCGLTQLYAMRYGTPPVVRATGGLIDTVTPYDEATGGGLGFRFHEATAAALAGAVGSACATYRDRPAHFAALRERGLRGDFGWGPSAAAYAQVYDWAVHARRGGDLAASA
ncbi:MAG: glycogen synthase GlgA [Verrucomicrobia bacterium]|nr:glycogen synthase GlgA [Verrucomicrobiota bacterium]